MSERTFAAADLTAMKIIDIRGIPNMEPVRGGTDEWYWATDYILGDLYEAEELFRDGHPVKSNRLYLIHYPDGAVYEPVPPVDGQYLGYPVYDGGTVALLAVNFAEQVIRILRDPENGCPWDKVQTHACPSAKTFWKRPARRWRPLTQMTPFCSGRNWETC